MLPQHSTDQPVECRQPVASHYYFCQIPLEDQQKFCMPLKYSISSNTPHKTLEFKRLLLYRNVYVVKETWHFPSIAPGRYNTTGDFSAVCYDEAKIQQDAPRVSKSVLKITFELIIFEVMTQHFHTQTCDSALPWQSLTLAENFCLLPGFTSALSYNPGKRYSSVP